MPLMFRPVTIAALTLMLLLPLVGGCGLLRAGVSADLTLRSADDPERTLPADFEHAFYSFDAPDRVTIVLLQGPTDRPERAMTIRQFWKLRPGQTPLAHQATNAMVRYVHFQAGDDRHERDDGGGDARRVGVYSGAGLLRLDLRPGRERLPATLRHATLRLIDASPDYEQTIEEASLLGRIELRRDDALTTRLTRKVEQAVSHTLHYPRFVRSDGR